VHNGVSLQQMNRDAMYVLYITGGGVGIGDMHARAFTSANPYIIAQFSYRIFSARQHA